MINTSKRIAAGVYAEGQLSSAILEYETVLQRRPDDADVRAALQADRGQGEQRDGAAGGRTRRRWRRCPKRRWCGAKARAAAAEEVDDGRKTMYKIFVESKIITAGDFDLCWRNVDLTVGADRRGGAVHPDAA